VCPRVAMNMAVGMRPPSSMKLVSTAERHLARQLCEERDERNKAVSALWARLEQVDQQIHKLQATPPLTQLPMQPALPPVLQDSLVTSTSFEAAQQLCEERDERNKAVRALWARFEQVDQQIHKLQATPPTQLPVHCAGTEVNGQVTLAEIMVQTLMERLNESGVPLLEGPPELVSTLPTVAVGAAGSGTGGSLEGPRATTADAIAALQTSVKDLDVKQQQQTKELAYLKGMLIEVHIGVQMNAIRASRIALQSTDLSRDERYEAQAALDKKELECKAKVRKLCNGPQLAQLMAEMAIESPRKTH